MLEEVCIPSGGVCLIMPPPPQGGGKAMLMSDVCLSVCLSRTSVLT